MDVSESPGLFARDAGHLGGWDPNILATLSEMPEEGQESFQALIDDFGRSIAQSLREGAVETLAEQRSYRQAFEKRLTQRWQAALDLYEVILIASQEAGQAFNKVYRPDASVQNDVAFEVLSRLHARACLVASEVLTLIQSGHADGAHSRWRTLHEIAVVAHFISEHGQDVAERYLLHDAIQAAKAAEQYCLYQARLGLEPISTQEMAEHRERKTRLVAQYGEPFAEDYGWAAYVLNNRRPNLATIERAVDLDHHRVYYRMASIAVHPNARAIRFSLAADPETMMLAGPSDGGLADPGHSALISLLSCTICLLNLRTGIEQAAITKTLEELTNEAGEAFLTAHREWERVKEERISIEHN